MAEVVLTPEKKVWLKRAIDRAQRVLVTCHVSPDGDAVGSSLALAHVLKRYGKEVLVVTPTAHPDFLNWMPGSGMVQNYEYHESRLSKAIESVDLFFCLDFNSVDRLKTLAEPVMKNPAPKVLIDHHLNPEDFPDLVVSHPEMSSTCELLFYVLRDLEGVDPMTLDEAVCLYTGMMTDTGGFTYNSNRPGIYAIIAQLMEKGIDKDAIYRHVFNNYSVDRFRLMGELLSKELVIFPEYHAALITMSCEEQQRHNYQKGDSEGFVNIPLQIKGMRLSIFLRENQEAGNIRVSLRSVGDVPCNLMAGEFFSGGGHKNASGGELICSMDEAVGVVKAALEKYHMYLED